MPAIESCWTRAGGFLLHARVSTVTPRHELPAVFVHGIGVGSPYMVPTMERLAPWHRAYALDLPGFGRSEKPPRTLDVPELADALAAWIDGRAVERPALVGNSFGCQVVVELAARGAGHARCLVLLGPTMDRLARNRRQQTLRWLSNARFERPAQLPLLIRDYAAAGLRRTLATFRCGLRDHIEEKLPRVTVPVLVMRGGRDPIVPQRWAEEVARLVPSGRLVVVPGAGHTLNFNAPDQTARVLRAYLRHTG
jgi:2-hydroxy-6-oxonona-2,4-dienedioate hydrolase